MSFINIKDFGAVGDGKNLDSGAINKAIQSTATAGGGTVHIPAGTYRCGTISLASNIHLSIDRGASIVASHDIDDFPKQKENVDINDDESRHLIVAKNCHNIAISGGGTD